MEYANFNISLKLILCKGDRILILTETKNGCLDFPGGRIEKNEKDMPLKDLFKREIEEELGKDVKYEILDPVIQYRRHKDSIVTPVLVTVYEANYLSGEIKLSSEHNHYEWVDPKTYNLKDKKFQNEEKRLAFENYFQKLRKTKFGLGHAAKFK